ncbi:unnamed protein product [Brachionus calyciflorus]|uniref:Uncharacterized protein n=1 Tax=Brachionus calyciflorus TaxID=104777 RepID=A0A814Q4J2_9BILA|nr:unnamed protein product [Brachionus calyciflorus]
MKRSHIQLALGQSGVTFRCLNPCSRAKWEKMNELDGGSLSVLTISGIPKVENTSFNKRTTTSAVVFGITRPSLVTHIISYII